ncbi:MAG: restriction endonuclease subunit S [Syntrophales bacterium]
MELAVMVADLKPYPAMKDSGVPWLGEVPEHWEVQRLGALVRERSETNNDNRVKDVLSVMRERGVIPYADKGNVGNKKSDDISRYKIVRPNDIVVNCMNVIIGSVGLSKYTGCLSPVYYVLTRRSEIDDSRYLNACFQTKPFQLSLVRIGNGILAHRMRIPMELLKCEPFPRPPATEQAAIVQYLDYMDRRIRKYVRAKQKLIKLLEEQKLAIIHHAVTRGLDPYVRLKPSGVEWIGDIPEHWEVWQVGHLSQIGNGSTPLRGNSAYWSDGHNPWLNSSCVNHENVTQADQFVTDTALLECHLPVVPAGSVLVAITGQGKTRGKAAVLRIASTINQHIAYITPSTYVASADFLRMVFHGAYAHLRAISDDSGSTKGALTCADLKHFKVALPSVDEQEKVLTAVQAETRTCNDAIARAELAISLLREYRTRLIADVVTGKLDVREAAARLPDEVDEPEPLDDMVEPTETESDDPVEEAADAG